MGERDDFDRIVEGLDLDIDLTFPDEPGDPVPEARPQAQDSAQPVPLDDEAPTTDEEQFYRQVGPAPLVPRRRGTRFAWGGVLGAPLLLGLAALADVFVARSVVAGASLIFVASAIYLFLQLPEHGPSRRDWPDDGAVL